MSRCLFVVSQLSLNVNRARCRCFRQYMFVKVDQGCIYSRLENHSTRLEYQRDLESWVRDRWNHSIDIAYEFIVFHMNCLQIQA